MILLQPSIIPSFILIAAQNNFLTLVGYGAVSVYNLNKWMFLGSEGLPQRPS